MKFRNENTFVLKLVVSYFEWNCQFRTFNKTYEYTLLNTFVSIWMINRADGRDIYSLAGDSIKQNSWRNEDIKMVRFAIIFVVINFVVLRISAQNSPIFLRDGKWHQTPQSALQSIGEQITPAMKTYFENNDGIVVKQFCINKIIYSYYNFIGADNDQYRNLVAIKLNSANLMCNVKSFIGFAGYMMASDVECYPLPKPYVRSWSGCFWSIYAILLFFYRLDCVKSALRVNQCESEFYRIKINFILFRRLSFICMTFGQISTIFSFCMSKLLP